MSSIEKPVHYYNFATARSHLHGATLIGRSSFFKNAQKQFLAPLYLLLGNSLELYLKAFLQHCGISESALKVPSIRHDLARLYSDAVQHGLDPPHRSELERIINWVAPHHSDFTFRYMKTNKAIEVPLTYNDVEGVLRVMTGLDEYLFNVLEPMKFV